MVIICFHSPSLCIRGSSVALYDYAHYNETILNNKSIIIVPEHAKNSQQSLIKFVSRFKLFFYNNIDHMNQILEDERCDIFYTIKYGKKDDVIAKKPIRTVVHCVFDLSEPHGDVYAAVSCTLAKKYNSSVFVPHMIGLKPDNKENLRLNLGIPINAVVFGRLGGMDTFDLTFCHNVINKIVVNRSDIYFVFINTPVFSSHNRVIFIKSIVNSNEKNRFINTCDAHLECGSLGHTFGIAMGEFSINNKPIIAYNGNVWNTAHFDILKDKALYFKNEDEFYNILNSFNSKDWIHKDNNCYKEYSPENVMKQFNNVFIL